MPARNVRYRPDNASFGEMMLSPQIQRVADSGADDIAAIATGMQKISETPYRGAAHPPIVLDGNPRAAAQVVGDDRLHAVEEFGSGTASEGRTAGQPRPQGGYSQPRRTLARAAAVIVPPAEVRPS